MFCFALLEHVLFLGPVSVETEDILSAVPIQTFNTHQSCHSLSASSDSLERKMHDNYMTTTVTVVNISHTLNNHAVNHAVNKICTINKASNLNVFLLMSLEYVVDLKTINICRSMNNKLSLHAFSWSLACTLYL